MSLLNVLEGLNKPYKIYADTNTLEHGALEQFTDAMRQDFTLRGALMPDAHQGYSLPIGGVIETDGYILPSYVGYDIGCGMCAIKTSFKRQDVHDHRYAIRDLINSRIPVGFNKRDEAPSEAIIVDELLRRVTPEMFKIYHEKKGHLQLGTLGGGNHFIELSTSYQRGGDFEPDEENVWIIIHSGSRGVGHGCATHYMKAASPTGKASEGHFGFDVDSEMGENYIIDMGFCLEYALLNRRVMIDEILSIIYGLLGYGGPVEELINRNHNHAETSDGQRWIHRKGATHAEKGMWGVIPGNMRDGSFIVIGKGNEDSLNSSSHGAGRVLGRKKAKETLDVYKFQDTMKGIVAPVSQNTLDESPFAYKDIFEVMDLQSDLVEVVTHCKPMVVVKG